MQSKTEPVPAPKALPGTRAIKFTARWKYSPRGWDMKTCLPDQIHVLPDAIANAALAANAGIEVKVEDAEEEIKDETTETRPQPRGRRN